MRAKAVFFWGEAAHKNSENLVNFQTVILTPIKFDDFVGHSYQIIEYLEVLSKSSWDRQELIDGFLWFHMTELYYYGNLSKIAINFWGN